MTHVAILGITGRAGSRIATELLQRGHTVTGIARNVVKAEARPGLSLKQADATQLDALVALLRGHDAVISATHFAGGIDAATAIAAA